MSIIGEKQDKGVQNQNAQELAQAQSGEAIAELLIKLVQDQGKSLKMHLTDLTQLTTAGRIGFRVAIDKHLKGMNAYVKAKKNTPEYETFRRAKNSAAARLSETVSFTKAVDAGYTPNMADSYHAIIAVARTFLDASSTGSKRGAKPVPVLDKIRKYLDKLHLPAKVLKEVEVMVHDMTVVTAAVSKPAPTKIKAIKVAQPARASLAEERAAAKAQEISPTGRATLARAVKDALI